MSDKRRASELRLHRVDQPGTAANAAALSAVHRHVSRLAIPLKALAIASFEEPTYPLRQFIHMGRSMISDLIIAATRGVPESENGSARMSSWEARFLPDVPSRPDSRGRRDSRDRRAILSSDLWVRTPGGVPMKSPRSLMLPSLAADS
jgi:hypothetical protein